MSDLAVRQPTSIREYMHTDAVVKRFDEVLGNGNSGGYIASALIAVSQNDQLKECSRESIVGSALRAATMRLSVDPSIGHAYLVPIGKKCGLWIGYKGYYQMALRTNRYRYLEVVPVFKDEKLIENRMTGLIEFDMGNGVAGTPTRRRVKYDVNEIQGIILYFKLVSGFEKTFYMTVEELEEHGAQFSKTYNNANGIWKTNKRVAYEKTVIKLGLLRWGYLDPSDITNIQKDETEADEVIEGETVETDVPIEEPQKVTQTQSMDDLGYSEPKQKASQMTIGGTDEADF